MQFSKIALSLAALAPAVFATDCFLDGGSNTCMSQVGLQLAINEFCTNSTLQGVTLFTDPTNGFDGEISGFFTDESDCSFALNSIVDQCAGHQNGGSFVGTSLLPDFADSEPRFRLTFND